MQGETSDAHEDKPCDICGHVGYEELIMTCSKCCTAREHVYCTRGRASEVPEVWICEACLSSSAIVSPQSGGEKELNLLGRADHDVMNPGTPGDAYSDSGWQVLSKKPKMEIGKVKFLPTEEVISLSSRTANMVSPRHNNPGLKYVVSSSIVPMFRKTSIPSKIVTPKFSTPREKANPKVMSSGSVKPLTHGGAEISTTIGRYEVKTPKQSKEDCGGKQQPGGTIYMPAKEGKKLKARTKIVKAANINSEDTIFRASYASSPSVHSTTSKGIESSNRKMEKAMNNTSPLMVSPITSSGQTFHVVSEPDNVAVDERDLLNILTKLEPYRRYLPAFEETWKGAFEFLDTASAGAFYGWFQARTPCRVHRKVFEFSKKLSSILQVKLFPRSHIWADLFGNDCPDFHDIALYFSPAANIERSKQNFSHLFELLEIQNSVMRSYIDGVELLIFTSKQLHVDCQRIVARLYTENFLWGVFRHVKSDHILHESSELPSLFSTVECACDDDASMDNIEAIDMDIDMEGGRIVGPIDVVSKELSGRGCGSHDKGDVNSATEKMLLEPRMRQYTSSKLFSKSLENKCKITSEHPLEISKGKLVNTKDDSAFPPGFKERPSLNSRNIENKAGVVDGGVINPVKKDNVGLQGVSGAAFGASSPPPQRSSEHFKLASQNHHQKPTRDLAYDPSAAFTPLSVKDNRRELKIKAEGNGDQNPHRTWKKDLEVEAKRKMNTSVCWRPPPKNWVKLNIEGCSSGVLGSAGAGGIVRDESGKWLLGYSKNLGASNRLTSELWALYHGLDLVLERGFRKVLVESVSHEAMKCLHQPTAYLDANRDLIQSCRDLLHHNWDCRFQHINQEANLCANWLATHCDLQPLRSLSIFNTPPYALVPIFHQDSTGIV